MAGRFVTWFLLVALSPGYGQVHRYMIFFKDKAGSSYSVSNPLAFLSDRALERRFLNEASVTVDDLPVNASYVQSLRDAGATVLFTTRWMNGALCTFDIADLPGLEALGEVDHVEFVAPGAESAAVGRKRATKSERARVQEITGTQLHMLGIDEMHDDNKRGEGVIISILDDGFQGVNTTVPFQHIINEGRLSQVSYDFVGGGTDVFRYDEHGTEVLSVAGAFQAGVYTGGAYKATFQLFVTEDNFSEFRVEEYNWLFAAERADSAGTDIIQTSLGYNTFDSTSMNYTINDLDGQTAVITRGAQMAAERGIIVIASAGNEGNNGWKRITAPADARDVLAVGNVTSTGLKSPSSSTGPTADGRIKPDVMALGTGAAVIRSNGTTGNVSGTSFSAPLVTSLLAGLIQRYPLMKASALIEAVRSAASNAHSPDNQIGYGIPSYSAVVNYMERMNLEQPLAVYPNPVIDTVNIYPRDPTLAMTFELLDAQGRRLAADEVQFSWTSDRFVADLSAQPAGFYILRSTLDGVVYNYRLVKN